MIRMKVLCVVLISIASTWGHSQTREEPKPVPEQCKNEAKVWDTTDHEYWRRFPYSELSRRLEETYQCTLVDKQNETHYMRIAIIIQNKMNSRMMGFLFRHKEWDKFVAEDGSGEGR